ncbi:hypothetical protein NQZ68_033249 [Dissostichus eleginoides]|nr:hypothetical protein NQZ68_033249 [Dissostichus eleginoides]
MKAQRQTFNRHKLNRVRPERELRTGIHSNVMLRQVGPVGILSTAQVHKLI